MEFRKDHDLRQMMISAQKTKLNKMEKLGKQIEKYDYKHDKPAMDSIFSEASELRSRRLDFAVYNFAMLARTDHSATEIEAARRRVLWELKRHKTKVKHTGFGF